MKSGDTIFDGQSGRYLYCILKRLDHNTLQEIRKAMKRLGLEPLGCMVFSKVPRLVIEGFAGENVYGVITIDTTGSDRISYEFYSRFSSGSSLTTTIVARGQDRPRAYFKRCPGLPIEELYEEHFIAIANLQSTPRKIENSLKGLARAMDEFNVRNKEVFFETSNAPNLIQIREWVDMGQNLDRFFVEQTPLMWAVGLGESDIIERILAADINLDAKTKQGQTALIIAASHGRQAIARALLEKGADPNIANKAGQTALIIAAIHGHTEIAKVLLHFGANPHATTRMGSFDALNMALSEGHIETARVLLNVREVEDSESLKKSVRNAILDHLTADMSPDLDESFYEGLETIEGIGKQAPFPGNLDENFYDRLEKISNIDELLHILEMVCRGVSIMEVEEYLVSFTESKTSFADLTLADAAVSLLAGHLQIRLPLRGRADLEENEISTEREARFILNAGGERRLVIMAYELFKKSGTSFIEEGKKYIGSGYNITEFSLENSLLQALAYYESHPKMEDPAILAFGLLLAHPDGTVQQIEFFVNPESAQEFDSARNLARHIARTVDVGPRMFDLQAKTVSLGQNDKDKFYLQLPTNYYLLAEQANNSMMYQIEFCSPLLETSIGQISIYLGWHPSRQYHRSVAYTSFEKIEMKILTKDIIWRRWRHTLHSCTAIYRQECLFQHPNVPKLYLHICLVANSRENLAELANIVTTLHL